MSTTVGPMFEMPHRAALPAPAHAHAGEADGIGFADIIRILKQRKLMIMISAILLYALVVATTLGVAFFAPAFTSEAIFEMLPPKDNDYIERQQLPQPEVMEQMLQTEARKIKQLDLMFEVVSEPEVKTSEYFRWYESDVGKAALGLQKDLVAAPLPESRLIRVALATKSRKEANTIVSLVSKKFQSKYSTQSREDRNNGLKQLTVQESGLQTELSAKRELMQNLRKNSDLSRIEGDRGQREDIISSIQNKLTDIESSMASLQAQEASYQGRNPEDMPLTAEQRLVIDSDPILRYYTAQVVGLDVQISSLRMKYGEKHRDMIQLIKQREEYKAREMGRREELVDDVRMRQIESIHQQVEELRAIQTRYSEKLEEAQSTERDLDKKMLLYKQYEADEDMLKKQLETITEKKRQAEFITKDDSATRLRIYSEPREAVKASRPDYPIWLGGGAFLALAGAIGLAFLRELTDTAIRTPSDVGRHGHLPLLGSVPRLDDEETDVDRMELVTRDAPASLVAESFRKIRTNLLFSGPADTQRTLLVTSAGAEDGKTSVAVNLAITMAMSSKRVLLVDCNFRRPALRGLFAGTRAEGLSNILIGQGVLKDYVTGTDVPNLFVLTSGPMPPNGAELLGSPRMQEFIATAAAGFDHVVFDGPPALLISDASVVAMQVQGVIAVIAAEEVSRGELRRLRDQLEMIGARVVGVVLNGVRVRAGGYFKRQYREFYDYMADDVTPAELPAPPPDKPE